MCFLLRLIGSFAFCVLLSLAIENNFNLNKKESKMIPYRHSLTNSLHIKVSSSGKVRLYLSFCQTNAGELIAFEKTIDKIISSLDLYTYRQKTKCERSADAFYDGSLLQSVLITVENAENETNDVRLQLIQEDKTNSMAEMNKELNIEEKHDMFMINNEAAIEELIFRSTNKHLKAGEIYEKVIDVGNMSDVTVQLKISQGSIILKVLSEEHKDTGTLYKTGERQKHYAADLLFGDRETNGTWNGTDTYTIKLWMKGEDKTNIADIFVYRISIGEHFKKKQKKSFLLRLGIWAYIIGGIIIAMILILLVMIALIIIHYCYPNIAIHDGFEVINAYSVRNAQKADNQNLPLQTYT